MILAAHQPNFLPWAGFFHKVYSSDAFVILDAVQYSKNGWTNRVQMKNAQGAFWLTVPVLSKGRAGQAIKDVEIDDHRDWQATLWKSIEINYRKAPYWEFYSASLHELLSRDWTRLVDLNMAAIRWLLGCLSIQTPLVLMSDLDPSGQKTELLIDLCRKVDATVYLSGEVARDYNDEDAFNAAKIELRYQNFVRPAYPQRYGAFVSGLSVMDMVFNCGELTLQQIIQAQRENGGET